MKTRTKCKKCSGKGRILGYVHIQGGVCFRCDGSGIEGVTLGQIETTKAAGYAAAEAAFNAEMDALEAATGEPWYLARLQGRYA